MKYHAELAHIERFWMWLKQKIQGRLNGKLAKLKTELWEEYGKYTLLDARKAARHCRETMEAYRRLAEKSDLGLNDLDKEQMKVYSTHRRVFDANRATLCFASDMPASEVAVRRAEISKTRMENKNTRQTLMTKAKNDIESYLKRRKRHERSAEENERDEVRSKTAKARMQQRNGY